MEELLAAADATIFEVLGTSKIVRYRRADGDEVAIPQVAGKTLAIFDDVHATAQSNGLDATTSSPRICVRLSDLNSDPEEDLACTLIIAGEEFDVTSPEKDGKGLVSLKLRRRSAS